MQMSDIQIKKTNKTIANCHKIWYNRNINNQQGGKMEKYNKSEEDRQWKQE